MLIVFKYNFALAQASISTTKIDKALRQKYLHHGRTFDLNAQEMALMLIEENSGLIEDLDIATRTVSKWRAEGKIRSDRYLEAKLALAMKY